MKFFNLITLTSLLSFASASYYKANKVTYYGGSNDNNSERDPFCQDYSDKVPEDLAKHNINYYVAISRDNLSKSTAKSYCGKTIKISNAENGRSLNALVVDRCGSCSYGNIDLSRDAFRYLSNNQMSKGVLKQVSWCVVGGPSTFACPDSSSSGNKTTKKTTTKKTTTKTTSVKNYSSSSSDHKTAGGIYVELEKGTRYGYASVERKIKYYSGSGYVKFTKSSHNGSTTKVAVKVNMKYAGKYNIKIKYNNPNSSKVSNKVVINNSEYKISFEKSGSEWKKVTLRDVKFNKGENVVAIKASDGYMNFDYIYIE
ncbi:hypothetical protein BCR32DRAFT_326244 [Anaeromyces robustus]|jgi:hypothetical protein|uniref:CBM6 domain-containing protein n=1 Tax=Anaeromyces robustus TaxID=1754192 RepID=A0A1Y1XD64_9FUNG|nr:hypothetical protein BCR32DRAFT_326244 [Anaeromyces robustus]|eukprot:ORX83731.1 hypothetical protein BCR32DRAFT_326244 [Anaeromyces robustus]